MHQCAAGYTIFTRPGPEADENTSPSVSIAHVGAVVHYTTSGQRRNERIAGYWKAFVGFARIQLGARDEAVDGSGMA